MGKFVLALLASAAALSACSSSTHIGGKAPSSVVTEPSTATLPGGDSVTTAAPSTPPAREDIQISGKGFTQLQPDAIGNSYVTYAVLISNPNPAADPKPWVASLVNLNITFSNATGQVVASENPSLDVALPGQVSAVTGHTQATGITSMTVQANVDNWQQNDQPITGGFTVSGVSSTSDSYGSAKTVGVLHSTFEKDYKELVAAAIYEQAAGQILGGDDTFVDFVPAGGQASFSIDALNGLPPGTAKTVVYPGFSSLSDLNS